jgi:hypothetical protein
MYRTLPSPCVSMRLHTFILPSTAPRALDSNVLQPGPCSSCSWSKEKCRIWLGAHPFENLPRAGGNMPSASSSQIDNSFSFFSPQFTCACSLVVCHSPSPVPSHTKVPASTQLQPEPRDSISVCSKRRFGFLFRIHLGKLPLGVGLTGTS